MYKFYFIGIESAVEEYKFSSDKAAMDFAYGLCELDGMTYGISIHKGKNVIARVNA